jgi:microcystin degradation protein MlrC
MTLRVALASLMQETNSFSPLSTTLETFENYHVLRGDQILSGFVAARVEVAGFLSVLREAGAMAVPLVSAYAAASGPVTRSCFDVLVGEIEARMRAAGPVDGLLLALQARSSSKTNRMETARSLYGYAGCSAPSFPLASASICMRTSCHGCFSGTSF